MTILGIVALLVLVVLGIMVLRVKGDPSEKASVRKYLAESKGTKAASDPPATPGGDSTSDRR